MKRMKLSYFFNLNAVFLSVFCLATFAIGDEVLATGKKTQIKEEKKEGAEDLTLPLLFSQEISLWPENSKVLKNGIKEISNDEYAANHPWLVITHPTMIRYSPKSHSARAAILVFPGGGYKGVAIGQKSTIGFNGVDVCKWLTNSGVTCFILKYRVPNSGCSWNAKTQQHDTPNIPMALQDAQRAISIVRYHAKEYDIDPNKIGVLGFSAGGNLAVLASTAFKKRAYDPIDEIDQVSSRPDFAIPVYPGHLTMEHKNKIPKSVAAQELNTDIEISTDVPPTLLIHAKDDPVDPVHYSEVYERELKNAGVNVKLLLYKSGGHAFGVQLQGKDTDRWTVDALSWLKNIKIL